MQTMKSPVLYDFFYKPLSQSVVERQQKVDIDNYKSLPATITKVSDYEELQCVDVQIAIDDVYVTRADMVLEKLTLKKVFVSLMNSGGFSIKQPVSVGDPVKLSWASKDISKYLDGTGGNVSVSINELANLQDCWVELRGGTRKNHTKPSVDNLVIEGGATEIVITPKGEVTINTSGTSYLKSEKHTIDTDVEITGNLVVKKNTTTEGETYAQSGVFASTYAGLAGVSAPAIFEVDMQIEGDTTQTGTFTINGVVVNTHNHNGQVPPME